MRTLPSPEDISTSSQLDDTTILRHGYGKYLRYRIVQPRVNTWLLIRLSSTCRFGTIRCCKITRTVCRSWNVLRIVYAHLSVFHYLRNLLDMPTCTTLWVMEGQWMSWVQVTSAHPIPINRSSSYHARVPKYWKIFMIELLQASAYCLPDIG